MVLWWKKNYSEPNTSVKRKNTHNDNLGYLAKFSILKNKFKNLSKL